MSGLVRQKQEKQEELRRKNEKLRVEQEKQSYSNRNTSAMTLKQAEHEVFILTTNGQNYRDIAQRGFDIVGIGTKRFSISQISKIKKKFENSDTSATKERISDNINHDKSEIFKLLREGQNLRSIVEITHLDPVYVKTTFYEYLDLNGMSEKSVKVVYTKMKEWKKKFQNEAELGRILDKAFGSDVFVDNLCYMCDTCKKPVYLGPGRSTDWREDLTDGLVYLSTNHRHRECD